MKKICKEIVSVILIVGPAFYFGYIGKPAEMAIALFAGFASAVLLNINKFESFKAGQLEAKLKEANEVIQEANITLNELQSVSLPMMNYLLTHIIYEDKIIGIHPKEKDLLLDELVKNYDSFEVADSSIKENIYCAKYSILDNYYDEICRYFSCLGVNVQEHHDQNLYVLLRDFKRREEIPTADEIRNYFKKHKAYNDETEKRIQDYEKFRVKHNLSK